jgi:hypothetical protein
VSAFPPTAAHARSTHLLLLERLEDRTLLSGNPLLRDVTVRSIAVRLRMRRACGNFGRARFSAASSSALASMRR